MSCVCTRGAREVLVLEVCAQELGVTRGCCETGFPSLGGGLDQRALPLPCEAAFLGYALSQDRLGTFWCLLCFKYEMQRWCLCDTSVSA